MATEQHEESEVEILAPATQAMDSATLALLNKSEIDIQISTAKKYPRQITKVLNTAIALATASAEIADEMIYALPRAGKFIEGPSIRFAEVLAHSWGNCRCGARVMSEDAEFITSMGTFADLEANVTVGFEVKRRITNKKGERFNADVIQQTANAASAIALRNAILRGIPRAIWIKVYSEARKTVAGDVKTLDARRAAAMKAFEMQGAKREQIFEFLGVKGLDDINLEHLVTLRGLLNALREGDLSVAKAFAPKETQDTVLADKSKSNLEAIKERYAKNEQAPAPVSETDPAKAEKMRQEAARQKQAVAEKYGASQPQVSEEEPAVAPEKTTSQAPAPSEAQEASVNQGNPPVEAADAGASAASPEPEGLQHGLPGVFDDVKTEKRGKK